MNNNKNTTPMSFLDQITRLCIVSGIVLTFFSIAGFLGNLWWVFDVLAHFRAQYAVLLILPVVIIFLLHKKHISIIFLVVAIINFIPILPYLVGFPSPKRLTGTKPWKIMTMNVLTKNIKYELVKNLIKKRNPDIMLFIETDNNWLKELSYLKKEYPYWTAVPRPDNFGITFFSRIKPTSLDVKYFVKTGVPSIVAEYSWNNKNLTLVGTHPPPPRKYDYAVARDNQFIKMAKFLNSKNGPKILMGDLNTTPWSVHFKKLLKNTKLRDSAIGRGLHPTWPTFFFMFWTPIDHILISSDLAILNRVVGGFVGSDHYPVEIELAPMVSSKE